MKGGCQLKFATGIGLSTIGLLNTSFSLVPTDSARDNVTGNTVAQVKIVRDKRNDWWIPNGVVYAHFLSRVAKYTSLGGSIGVNIDFKEIKSSGFNLGLTSSFGNKYSMSFTLGTVFGNVQVLNGKYERDMTYQPSQVDPSSLTTTAYRFGLFFGVSLNLSSTELGKKSSQ